MILLILSILYSNSLAVNIILRNTDHNLMTLSKPLSELLQVNAIVGSELLNLDMEVLLYSNISILTTCPSNGSNYYCSADPSCHFESNDSVSIQYLFQSYSGNFVTIPLFLSTMQWGSSYTNLFYTNSCDNFFSTSNTSGAIALGTSGMMSELFIDYTNFSVKINENSDGVIIFGISDDFENYQQTAFISQDVSPNWEIQVSRVYAGNSFTDNYLIVFDVSFEYVGIPKLLFLNIIEWLSNNSVICNNQSTSLPTICHFYGLRTFLPSIYFYTSSIIPIEISASIYLIPNGNEYYLAFVGTDTNDSNYVIVNQDFQNYIILGVSFLKNYFPIFDFSNPDYPTITIYDSTYSVLNNPSNIIFMILMIILSLACGFSCYKFFKKKQIYSDLKSSLIDHGSFSETPSGDSTFNGRILRLNS